MINCSHNSPTTEETRSWQPNNKSTRGLPFNACTALGRSPANHSARSTQRNQPRSAPPTGTRQSLSLSNWDSAISQPLPLGLGNLSAPPIGTRQSLSPSHWDSTIAQPLKIVSPAHQAQIKARRSHKCPPRPLWDLLYL
ncbi:hypothetical protein Adt_38239 [Abeliophyllum distichum]|uniref:Uncharacterized protein n=1 Tax=Abeliophyllum distichum TaxID=126358 RepID=A0ABD1Q1N3_9LAMI